MFSPDYLENLQASFDCEPSEAEEAIAQLRTEANALYHAPEGLWGEETASDLLTARAANLDAMLVRLNQAQRDGLDDVRGFVERCDSEVDIACWIALLTEERDEIRIEIEERGAAIAA